ncbi:hypothetical protein [Lysinibacillus sp. FSL K6-3209]|uniref:hypothetical protein n=1 Tax=Lysinibacillus sp. FSL K6-3209 TaxID=2921497 RepID=UPI0030DABAC7
MIKKHFFSFFAFLFLLVGCSNKEVIIVKKHEIIEIGIVGEIPSLIKENNIKFKKIMLQDLHKQNEDSFDAIMITKDYLQEASDEQYTQFYLDASIPIVFVQSDKAISAFIIPNHTYENTFENHAQDYFIGYYKGTTFGVALNGNTNEDLIKGYWSLFDLLARLIQTNN